MFALTSMDSRYITKNGEARRFNVIKKGFQDKVNALNEYYTEMEVTYSTVLLTNLLFRIVGAFDDCIIALCAEETNCASVVQETQNCVSPSMLVRFIPPMLQLCSSVWGPLMKRSGRLLVRTSMCF